MTASLGSLLGILTTCLLGMLFTDLFHINGAVMPDAESLLYSGFQHLDLTAIFMSSIFIGASGAMMDLSVDITSAVQEVVEKKPEIGWREAARSGMNVGRAAMGTMTTTLLLAYSGGYITLLMVFMAQGTPADHILNYKYRGGKLWTGDGGAFYGFGGRNHADKKKIFDIFMRRVIKYAHKHIVRFYGCNVCVEYAWKMEDKNYVRSRNKSASIYTSGSKWQNTFSGRL